MGYRHDHIYKAKSTNEQYTMIQWNPSRHCNASNPIAVKVREQKGDGTPIYFNLLRGISIVLVAKSTFTTSFDPNLDLYLSALIRRIEKVAMMKSGSTLHEAC